MYQLLRTAFVRIYSVLLIFLFLGASCVTGSSPISLTGGGVGSAEEESDSDSSFNGSTISVMGASELQLMESGQYRLLMQNQPLSQQVLRSGNFQATDLMDLEAMLLEAGE